MTLEEENRQLRQIIFVSQRRISELEEEVRRLMGPKRGSTNSSVPPSQDPFRIKRTESLREKTGKKPGGQPGHEGETLEMISHPDLVIDHKPRYCNKCGQDLSSFSSEFAGKRQLIDLPKIEPVITEHHVYTTKYR